MKALKFRERFNEILNLTEITQRELAERCHISETNIPQYKSGHTQPSLQILMNFCKILDVSADYLLGLTDDY